MVRYSKLPFRLLLRSYAVDVSYTPMMLAHEFIRHPLARDSDFTTSPLERETTAFDGRQHLLIAQFASNDPEEFAKAASMIAPWVDGVNLNCGCPQSWAIQEKIGCALMSDAETVAAIVSAAKSRLPADKSVSVKIRIHQDLDETVRFVHAVQRAGADYVTVHGRLRKQRSSTPPDYEAVRYVADRVDLPIVANGDAYSLADVRSIAQKTGALGVMAARGLMENPAMFAGYDTTPEDCIREFMRHVVEAPIHFALILHHVHEMMSKMPGMTKREKRKLMDCQDMLDLMDYLENRIGLNLG